MNIIVCLEDNNGMMFNKRRLSQDVAIREDIYNNLNENKLIMNAYSFKMFSKDGENKDIQVEENIPFLDDDNSLQFIEDKKLGQFEGDINKLIIYYWNRRYPSDLKFDIDVLSSKWNLESEIEFVGNSHEKITKRIFVKAK